MVYEIIQSEGWGRFGFIPSINDFFTPNIVNTILSSDWDNETSQLKLGGYENELNIPLCYIYPSLQMQGKILEDIKSYEDLFPEELKNRSGALEFHVIPWDLPNIYLDNFPEYIDTINQFDADFKNDEIKLVLNFPFSPEILNLNLPKLKSTAISTISLGDISSFLTNPDLLIKLIKFIKTWVSPDTLLYAPGIPLSYLPILTYLGIDLFDLFQIGMISANKNQIPDLIIEYDVSNRSFIEMIKRIRLAIKTNKLRDLVRIYANSYPPNKALLIKIDKNINLEENTPIFGSNTLYCTDETDFFRPEVVRFRNRVKERYFPSNYVKGVIFLPCSARKPYSHSKSHQLFQGVIRRTLKGKRHSVQEVILTSPLGIVPRELEYTYPAAHYDIPVTGKWSEVEKDHLYDDLLNFLNKINVSIPLIGYLKGTEYEILKKVCNDLNREILLVPNDNISLISNQKLKEFSSLLKIAFSDVTISSRVPVQLLLFQKIADFQFGKDVGAKLIPEEATFRGRKELGIMISYNQKHLLTFKPSTGLFTLSLAAGERMLDYAQNKVIFDGSQIQGSTIFTNAINEADPGIRPFDEVLIIDENKNLLATGMSYLSSNLLVKMRRGKGVKIRQKVK